MWTCGGGFVLQCGAVRYLVRITKRERKARKPMKGQAMTISDQVKDLIAAAAAGRTDIRPFGLGHTQYEGAEMHLRLVNSGCGVEQADDILARAAE